MAGDTPFDFRFGGHGAGQHGRAPGKPNSVESGQRLNRIRRAQEDPMPRLRQLFRDSRLSAAQQFGRGDIASLKGHSNDDGGARSFDLPEAPERQGLGCRHLNEDTQDYSYHGNIS